MEELIGNYYFIYPLIAHVAATGIKAIHAARKKKLSWRVLIQYGGFPSSHSAIVASLATIIGSKEGMDSAEFAITFILALLVIRDAFGLRLIVEKHGIALRALGIKTDTQVVLPSDVGHTVVEVIAGILVGVISTLLILAI